MARKTRKATFSLPEDMLVAVDEAVGEGVAPSKNALVERALVRELKEIRRQTRRARWEEAARAPLFLKDLDEIDAAFRSADAETAERLG
ncbi:MAG: hypothetical protein HY331_05270 [Chloroflexi bacterium]|nr:hypothetical protein [Chloroflexota bacterium]